MNNNFLKEENIITLFSLNNLIVPEMQREYVWGNNQHDVLSNFLRDIKSKAHVCKDCHHAHFQKKVNVGFLYSYQPPYVINQNIRNVDEYLIDGQQRITTIFLLLLCRASAESRMQEFVSMYRSDDIGGGCFKYKVRYLTQHFVDDLVEFVKDNGYTCLKDFVISRHLPNWFLSDYRKDMTIGAMINALKTIVEEFAEDEYYYDFILHNIYFWHFKTNITSQGEELYITMNSRGATLKGNELTKSKKLPAKDQIKYGEKWEMWQDFFWKNRGKNENADNGFDCYLSCIEGLSDFLSEVCDKQDVYDIETIEIYMKAIQYLFDSDLEEYMNKKYPKCMWFDSLKNKVLDVINYGEKDWHLSPKDEHKYANQGTIRNMAVLMWTWMYYLRCIIKDEKSINYADMARALHVCYLKYNAYNRNVKAMLLLFDSFAHGYDDAFKLPSNEITGEYNRLHNLYLKVGEKRTCLESIIWNIQDIPCILDSRDVGNDTIADFIDLIDDADVRKVEEKANALYENLKMILPNEEKECKLDSLLKSCMITYGEFWNKISPRYYNHYDISDWKRIFRSKAFVDMYNDVIRTEKLSLEKISESLKNKITEKRKIFFKDPMVFDKKHSDRELSIIYDAINPNINTLWTRKCLGFWQDEDNVQHRITEDDSNCFSMAGDARSNMELIKLPDNWKSQIYTNMD